MKGKKEKWYFHSRYDATKKVVKVFTFVLALIVLHVIGYVNSYSKICYNAELFEEVQNLAKESITSEGRVDEVFLLESGIEDFQITHKYGEYKLYCKKSEGAVNYAEVTTYLTEDGKIDRQDKPSEGNYLFSQWFSYGCAYFIFGMSVGGIIWVIIKLILFICKEISENHEIHDEINNMNNNENIYSTKKKKKKRRVRRKKSR